MCKPSLQENPDAEQESSVMFHEFNRLDPTSEVTLMILASHLNTTSLDQTGSMFRMDVETFIHGLPVVFMLFIPYFH